MKIKWLGHASFLITSDDGTKIITDPYVVGDGISYGEIRELADIVTISHQHADHSNAAAVRGNPQVITKPEKKKVKGINIKGVASYHDKSSGKERGDNIIFCFN
ncbi:MAG: MBL fold metallo-hydrolase, partial [Dehalococcoidia bacterium]|nr:MBL fold metallo-hydrolase [Dehalococcoidia bacterium]